MSFLRPLALIGLVIVPMIVALYLFKIRHREEQIPSLFLWSEAYDSLKAASSFQKLRKSLLMLLQILAALFCVFAMAAPYITSERDISNYSLVIDNSLSMSAMEGEVSRLDIAKAGAVELVKSSAKGSSFTVTELNSQGRIVVSASTDRGHVINCINAIGQSYESVNYDAIPLTEEDTNLILFTDREVENISTYTCGNSFSNWGIVSLTTTPGENTTRALAKVKSFGIDTQTRTISLYAGGELLETKDITLAPDETKDVIFSSFSMSSAEVSVRLTPEDNFTADDSRYTVISSGTETNVLLAGEVNPFLEKALGVMPGVSITRSENTTALTGYDLYIFEGNVPDVLPEDGHILLINPGHNSLFAVGEKQEITNVYTRDNTDAFFNLTESIDFQVYRSSVVTLPEWGNVIISSDQTPLIFVGDYNRQHIGVIAFDLSESDLPLKKDFPIFIYDVLSNFFPSGAVDGGEAVPGEVVRLNISPLSQEVRIISPTGSEETIAPPFPIGEYRPSAGIGIYYLEQLISNERTYEPFAVNIVPGDEEYFAYEANSAVDNVQNFRSLYNVDLSGILIILAALVLIVEIIIYTYKRRHNLPKLALVARTMVIILLILAFADVKLPMPIDGVTTVFVLDASDSMADNVQAQIDFVNEALENKEEDDYTALTVFGNEGVITALPEEDTNNYKITYLPDGGATNIQAGIERATSLFKESSGGRIVLLTDGSENIGDVLSSVRSLKEQGIEVKVCGFDHSSLAEVQITQLNVPTYVTEGSCRCQVIIDSTAREEVNLQLYVNGSLVYEEAKEVTIGENAFVIPVEVRDEGNIEFMATIEPQVDRYYQNNYAYASSYVQADAQVLLLEYNGSGEELENLFTSGGIKVVRSDIATAPVSIETLNNYEAVILADCPYYDMDEDFITALVSYVQNSAGGLLVTAGENSLAPGGYKGTELETILPVNMDLTDEDRKRTTAMVMVVDRSGSMSGGQYGVSKLELVKEAMARSVEILEPEDSVGILAFDDNFSWEVNTGIIGENVQSIEDKIYSINDGGGTSILPALKEAVNELATYEADSKHIILMTDGQGEDNGYDSIINSAKLSGITISTVAAGTDSDTALLEEIAANAGGRYYYTDEFTDLPKIFERETTLSDKSYINNEDFYPTARDSSPVLDNVEGVPLLNGYVASTAKGAATVALTHNELEPVLALWQYGLGRTAVFSADIQNQCYNWLSANEGQSILRNTLAYVMRDRSFGNMDTEVIRRNGRTIIVLETGDELTDSISATVDGNNISTSLLFEQVSPGVFEAEVGELETGSYVLNITGTTGEDTKFYSDLISIPYSREYDIKSIQSGTIVLDSLYLNGEKITSPTEVFTPYNMQGYDRLTISPYLLAIALVMFFTELVLRRFPLVIKLKKKTMTSKSKKEVTEPTEEVKPIKKVSEPVQKEEKRENTSSLLLKNKHKREK